MSRRLLGARKSNGSRGRDVRLWYRTLSKVSENRGHTDLGDGGGVDESKRSAVKGRPWAALYYCRSVSNEDNFYPKAHPAVRPPPRQVVARQAAYVL